MRRSPPGWAVPALAGTLGLWLVVDVVRQNQLGVADAGLWFVAAAGVVALTAATIVGRWPELRRMALLILWWLLTALAVDVGVAWPGSRVATTAFLLLLALQAPAYAHMALAYPSGYVRDRLERLFLVVAYTVSLLWELPPALFANGCRNCSPHAPSLLFTGHTFDLAPIGRVFWSLFIALGVGFIALVVRRVLRAPAGARRTLLPLGAAAVLACSQLIVQRVAWLTDWGQAQTMLDWLARANLLVVPLAILLGEVTIRRARGPLGDLVVELGLAGPGEIRAALARAVGDPSLELALWLPDRQQFVDQDGTAVSIEAGEADRATTRIGPADRPVAALTHDARLLGQRPLLEAAGSAAGSRSRTHGCMLSCAHSWLSCRRRAPGSLPLETQSAVDSSVTCMTVRSSGCSRLASRCNCSKTTTKILICSQRQKVSCNQP